MKQGTPPPPPPTPTKSVAKLSDMSQQSTTASRLRASAKIKESPRSAEIINGVSSVRAKSVPPDLKNNSKARRALVQNNPKSSEDVVGSHKGRELEVVKVVGRSVNHRQTMEQLARPRRRPVEASGRRNEEDPDGNKKELQEKRDMSENLIKNLQSEVEALKAELEKAKSLNVVLESQNRKLTKDLAAAEAKMVPFGSRKEPVGEHQCPKFKDIQKLIANKLGRPKVQNNATSEANSVKSPSPAPALLYENTKVSSMERKPPTYPSMPPLPPPPPPPIPSRPSARATNSQKAPELVDFYHSLKKQEGKKDLAGSGNFHNSAAVSAHSSIVGEIQTRSAHLLAIRSDIETKGDLINGLIEKVLGAAYMDIEDVLKFVDWLDSELSSLADERAVLRHFKWPERKADALREAAVEYRDLKLLESEISSYKDDPNVPCGASLKKMACLLDKSEQSIQRLIKLRNSVMCSYQDYKIPTAWMLDSGITSKIKQASMSLVKVYMKRVMMELESIHNLDRESSQESLLLQGVHFAYRAQQFAGGLDSETLCAFEEIKKRVPGHFAGSPELLAG